MDVLMEYQILRAKSFYSKAFSQLPKEDKNKQLPGMMMGYIYYDLLLSIEEGNLANILNERTQLTPIRKFYIIIKTILKIIT